jgi:YHS domain-containing protein
VKLLLIILIVYLAYRAGKAWILRSLGTASPHTSSNARIDDVMVKDPVCGIYFPKREGIELRHGGQILTFCSNACRDRFLEHHP